MLTMTDASDPRTIIDDNGKAYQVLGSGDETETLQRILDSDAAASALIIIADAVAGLGSALEAERSIESARAAWASSTDALLKVWRRARRRVKIINSACLSADESAQAALKPLGLAGAAAELRLCQPKPAMLSPLSLLCAAMMIQSDPALQRLARELEAATIGVGCSVDMWSTTSEAWLAARQQESVLGALRLEAQNAVVLERRLAEATSLTGAKLAALSEATAKLAAASTQNRALEQNLARASEASKKRETVHEQTTAKLTAAEHELELLRDTVGLQSGALDNALARLPQLEVLAKKVEALQGAATATTAVLAEAEANFKAAASRADVLQQKLTEANAKVVAHSELRAQLTDATERVSALEVSLAASRQQAAAYEKATAKLTAAEHELEILRKTAGLQSSALKDALARL
ncbi:MAG: hypothetical protein Q8M31_18610, partial [Beijerinckiaceae bacterium]|nr:hypothetical protein [Beijerinckiaceae bacterium]